MGFDTILYQVTDGVAVITLNRPAVMNALSSALRAEMLVAVRLFSGAMQSNISILYLLPTQTA